MDGTPVGFGVVGSEVHRDVYETETYETKQDKTENFFIFELAFYTDLEIPLPFLCSHPPLPAVTPPHCPHTSLPRRSIGGASTVPSPGRRATGRRVPWSGRVGGAGRTTQAEDPFSCVPPRVSLPTGRELRGRRSPWEVMGGGLMT